MKVQYKHNCSMFEKKTLLVLIAKSLYFCTIPPIMKLSAHKRVGSNTDATMVPGVCYGPETESISFFVNKPLIEKTFREVGMATIIDLDIEGEEHEVLIKEVQWHPVSGEMIHVDMYAIKRGVEMEITAPFEFVGEEDSRAVKGGGMLAKVMHEVAVRCKPRNIPSELQVDLSQIEEIGQSLTLEDITLPEGVAFVSEENETIAIVTEVRADAGEGEEGPDLTDPDAEPVEGEEGETKENATEESSEDK